MEPQGVDVPALLRRTFPLWLAWILYAAPALWAVLVVRAVTSLPEQLFQQAPFYDENGTLIPGDANPEPVGWLARFGVTLALSLGTPLLAPAELSLLGLVAALSLLGLVAAAVVTAIWAVRGRSFHLRSVAAVGAVFSVALGVVGVLGVVSRDAAYEAARPMWGPDSVGLFDGQFAVWGLVGIFGVILTWTFARLGFGPLPTVPVPDSQVAPELPEPDGAALEPEDGGADEPAAPAGPASAADVDEDSLAVYRRPSGPES